MSDTTDPGTAEPRCQVCGEGRGEIPFVACKACDLPAHKDCWGFTGECATFGCGSKVYRDLKAGQAEVQRVSLEIRDAGGDRGDRAADRARAAGQAAVAALGLGCLALGWAASGWFLARPRLPAAAVRDTRPADRVSAVWRRLGSAAEGGDALAQAHLGRHYEDGDKIRRAADQAAYWYQRALDARLPAARNLLGRLLYEGRGVAADPARARALFRAAAETGDSAAQANLGLLLAVAGDGDHAEAARWLEKAAASGDAAAAYNLALILEATDPAAARRWLTRAAETLPEAQAYLARAGEAKPAR